MILKRKIENQLIEWKNNPRRRPIVIKGPRQCGKTYSVLKFAKENYRHIVYLNFLENPNYCAAFAGSLKMDEIIKNLSSFPDLKATFVPRETVLVLDEIQDCPDARTALKFIHLDGRFDVICTGSLLGVKGYGKAPRSIPVGYENHLDMYPLDFEEFLWAVGMPEEPIVHLEEKLLAEEPIPQAMHESFRKLFLEYAIVGGMPAAVIEFCETKDIQAVQSIQREIVRDYKADMVKYAAREDRVYITECFDSIPAQLGKENKKFQYSVVRKGSKASMFAGSLQWIEDAGITQRCYNVTIPEIPLEANVMRDVFKVYMCDPGLFLSMLEEVTPFEILQGNISVYKGAVFENLVAGVFHKMGKRLYYFHKDSGLELDFVIHYNGRVVPVEVKATTGNAKSLRVVLNHPEKYHVTQAFKLGDYNIGRSGEVLTLPLYMAFLLNSKK